MEAKDYTENFVTCEEWDDEDYDESIEEKRLINFRKVERALFQNLESDKNDYLDLDLKTMELMNEEMIKFHFSDVFTNLIFSFVREYEGTAYIDVCVYHYDLETEKISFERFVVVPGFQMPEQEEEQFLKYMACEESYFRCDLMESFIQRMSEEFPELKMYPKEFARDAILRVYFGSINCGLRTAIFNEGLLGDIGIYLHEIAGVDVTETNVEEALGLPLEILKRLQRICALSGIVNCSEVKERVNIIYEKAPDLLLQIDEITDAQINYLFFCLEQDKTVDKGVLSLLGKMSEYYDAKTCGYHYEEVLDYQRYRGMTDEYKDIFPMYYDPSVDYAVSKFYAGHLVLRDLVENNGRIKDRIVEQYAKFKDYAYESSEYAIVIPESLQEYLYEAEYEQDNLFGDMWAFVDGYKTFFFLRRKADINAPYKVLYMERNVIEGMYAKNLKDIKKSERDFILDFARDKDLTISTDGIMREYVFKMDT